MPPRSRPGAGGGTHPPPGTLVGVLGDVTVWDSDGVPVPLAPQLRRLVGLFVTAGVGTLSTERLAGHLTDGRLETSAVRTAISRLRRILGQRVETTSAGYRLRLEPGELDADQFVDLIARAKEEAPNDGRPLLESALELWRGRPFGDLREDPWAIGMATRMEDLWAAAVESLAEVHIRNERSVDAIALLRQLVTAQPYREAPVALLMQQLAVSGRTVEALREYQRLRSALTEVGLEPSAAVRRVEAGLLREVLSDDDIGDEHIPRASGNLAVPADPFIGRDGELKSVIELTKSRLVTLVGAGGVGKTRLALEAAAGSAASFPSGVWFVPLASVSAGADVAATAVTVVNASVDAGQSPIKSIVDALRGQPALVLLDNAEHVIDACAELVEALLTASDTIHLLVTSREPLGIQGERVHHVAPLDAFDSVELFCTRAEESDDRFELDDGDRTTVEAICERLDGLPLAIELAAARTRTLTVADLYERLDDRTVLPRRGRTADHHATVRAAIDWSYQLLGDDERTVFGSLGVFAGSFDFAAVTSVCARDFAGEVDPGEIVLSLVNKSMVVADRSRHETRYSLLETIRQFSLDRLTESTHGDDVRARHVAYFTGVAKQARDINQVDPMRAAVTLDAEWDNFRAALRYALGAGDVDGAAALVAHLWVALDVGRYEHASWVDAVLAVLPEGHPRAPVLYCLSGWWANLVGDHRRAIRLAQRGLASAPPSRRSITIMLHVVIGEARIHLGDPVAALDACFDVLRLGHDDVQIRIVFILGCWAAFSTRPDLVAGFAARIEEVARRTERHDDRHQAAYSAGFAELVDGNPNAAVERFRESRRHTVGYPHLEAEALQGLTLAVSAANLPDASETFLEALRAAVHTHMLSHLWMVIETLAIHWADRGRYEEAAVLLAGLEAHERWCVFLGPGRSRAVDIVAGRPEVMRSSDLGRSLSRTELTDFAVAILVTERADGRRTLAGN